MPEHRLVFGHLTLPDSAACICTGVTTGPTTGETGLLHAIVSVILAELK